MILARFLRKYRFALLSTIILSSTSAAVTMALLAHINTLAAVGIPDRDARPLFIGMCWLAALLVSGAASQFLLAWLGSNLVAQLRTDLSQRFVELEYEKLADRKHSAFGSLIEDIANIAPLVLIAPLLAYNILLAVLYAAYLSTVSIPLLGILLVFLSTTIIISGVLERKTRVKFDSLRQSDEKVFEYFRAISEGKKEMALNTARASHFTSELLNPAIDQSKKLMTQVYLGWGFNEAWSTMVTYGSVFLIVYLGYTVLELPQATIIKFVIGALFFTGPINFITSLGKQVSTGTASLRHLEHVGLNLRTEVQEKEVHTAPDQQPRCDWRSIQIDSVCYEYPSDTEQSNNFGPVTLDFKCGEMVFIVGRNGSGKSTLLLLLSSLLSPKTGRVLIDGSPIGDDIALYRSHFSGVFGDFFLFPHVLDSAGKLLSDSHIEQLLQMLNLNANVEANQGELSKLTLSTGQRKRLALLKCYAENREIYFFDEWAADQDAHFREYFYSTLLPGLKQQGKTVIAISHDERYFHVADRVIELECGRVRSDTRT
jgi:cyclic peptide transporter